MIDGFKREINRRYYLKNREKLIENQMKYNKLHNSKYKAYQQKYKEKHKSSKNSLERTYLLHKARCKKDNVKCELDYEDVKKIFNYFEWTCAFCNNTENLEVGYLISRKYKGGMTWGNTIPICPHCRSSKKSSKLENWFNWNVMKYGYKRFKIEEYMESKSIDVEL